MFIGAFPYMVFYCLHTYLCIFYRPLWISSRRVKWFEFSVGTLEVKHQTHWHSKGRSASGPCLSGVFPPIWLINDCLHTYLCIFYRPLGIITRRIKWFDFSVGTMEVKYQTHWYSDGKSASGTIFIRGFPLYGYLMTVSTLICLFFITRCELFCDE